HIAENQTRRADIAAAGGIVGTRLYSHNADVETENNAQLALISGEQRTFLAKDRGGDKAKQALASCRARATIHLKIGAQVVLLKNLDQKAGLVNGSRGVVTAWGPPPTQ